MYLEDIKDGGLFLENLRMAVSRKPVLLIKSGRTQAGAKASASHTASLAVEDAVFDGAVRQAGAIRLYGIDDFIRTLKGFLNMPLPKGDRLAYVTYSGAQSIMSIDATVELGLKVAEFADATRARIAEVIATSSKMKNPIDIFPDWLANGFEKTITQITDALMDDDGVDGVVFIFSPVENPQVYQSMIDILKADRRKPVFVSFLGDIADKEVCQRFLEAGGLPCYDYPEHAVRVFSRMRQYARIKDR
jgi:acetyltransferase